MSSSSAVHSHDGSDSIAVSRIHKRYGTTEMVEALAGVDLNIRNGEFVCLLGPSGCGKSTLLRIMAGINRPSDGEVLVRASTKHEAKTATVFQDYGIFPWKTVGSNVGFGLEIAGIPKKVRRERVDRWLQRLGIYEFRNVYPAALSGGMKQRVSIARALAVEPSILFMDEPFAALDAQLRRVMQDELLELWQNDVRTVVFVTHNIDEALLLGDRVIVLSARPGRIIANIDVPFLRPRSSDVRLDPQFAELEQSIWTELRQEVGENTKKVME